MKISMEATLPNDHLYTMQVTMNLAEWRELYKELEKSNRQPVYEFKRKISDAVQQAEKTYFAADEDKS